VAISNTPVIERIARVLAGQRLSINAKGDVASASAEVDAHWRDYEDDALAVLRTLREPDEAIARAGDPLAWEAMVLAALGQDSAAALRAGSYEPPAPGTDPLHEGP
jgi:hypothetical protein